MDVDLGNISLGIGFIIGGIIVFFLRLQPVDPGLLGVFLGISLIVTQMIIRQFRK